MPLYLINKEQMLIGKLSKKSYKPFSINDKIIIEKNLYNLLGLRLLFNGYHDESEKKIAETIGYNSKTKTPVLLGYKKNSKDDFLNRYIKEYEKIMEEKERFEGIVKVQGRTDYLSEMEMVIIASHYSEGEISKANNAKIKVNLYTWSMIGDILVFDQVN